MDDKQPGFYTLAVKTAVVHTVTYFAMGVLASTLLDYASALARPEMACWMRQINDPALMAGPLFQPIRGLLFAMVIFPLREIIFARRRGSLLLGWLLVALGILGTFGPAPGSLEGLVYTVIPIRDQLTGYLEVVPQACLLAFGLVYWVKHPEKRWISWFMGLAFAAVTGLTVLGLVGGARSV
jgi:hypothetical protein